MLPKPGGLRLQSRLRLGRQDRGVAAEIDDVASGPGDEIGPEGIDPNQHGHGRGRIALPEARQLR
jgi:hypothetical protein